MAGFVKIPTPRLGTVDGFDSTEPYQMVPMGESREMSVVTDDHSSVLNVANPRVARLANLRGSAGLPGSNTVDQVTLPPHASVSFSIRGIAVGRTRLVLRPQPGGAGPGGGSPSSDLLVSVKQQRVKRFSICSLMDIRRSTQRQPEDAAQNLVVARKIFLNQANVDLDFIGLGAVQVLRDLGDPLDAGHSQILRSIVLATPQNLKVQGSMAIYLSWALKDEHGQGLMGGSPDLPNREIFAPVFVADDGLPAGNVKTVRKFAHEIGHALGLDHHGRQDHLMWPFDTFTNDLLFGFEIDTVNPSGTAP